jgi:hypothetical protein
VIDILPPSVRPAYDDLMTPPAKVRGSLRSLEGEPVLEDDARRWHIGISA